MKRQQKFEVNLSDVDAFIFDMDGVVTDTACIHAAAWKRLFDEFLKKTAEHDSAEFQPFDINSDYPFYVDGKPRYDGVKSFLESRGILLPYGSPKDDTDKETVCGLGNKKNRYFYEYIRTHKVEPYRSTVVFIETLKSLGIHTAIISASRNADEVLASAGVKPLFNIKVDGIDSDRLGLEGKPHPDIFLEAARQLRVKPERAAVVEDALAGVEAGRKGKFRLVIGVDRTGQEENLKKYGADIVVQDISQLSVCS
ncbi:HAD family hydrolase [Chloroflexota bacterium]